MKTRSSASSHGRNCHSTSAALTRTGNEEASSVARNLSPGHLSSRAKLPPEHPQQGADVLSCHATAAWSSVLTQRMPSSTTGPAGCAARVTFVLTLLHCLHSAQFARGSRALTMDEIHSGDVAVCCPCLQVAYAQSALSAEHEAGAQADGEVSGSRHPCM